MVGKEADRKNGFRILVKHSNYAGWQMKVRSSEQRPDHPPDKADSKTIRHQTTHIKEQLAHIKEETAKKRQLSLLKRQTADQSGSDPKITPEK